MSDSKEAATVLNGGSIAATEQAANSFTLHELDLRSRVNEMTRAITVGDGLTPWK
jgi:hypothetical protein